MQDRYRQFEGADQMAMFCEPAARNWFSQTLAAAVAVLLRRLAGR